MSVARQEYHII